ncbi:MAG: LiaF domain-containing protein [Bacteroidota bacterium]
MENNNNMTNRSGKVWAGLFIVGIGSLLLLDNLGLNLPNWLWHWSNILIVIGLFVGIKHNFRNSGWFVMVLIGSFFTLKEAFDDNLDFGKVVFPVMLVILGLFILFKPKNNCRPRLDRRRGRFGRRNSFQNFPEADEPMPSAAEEKPNHNDYLDSVNVFGGSHQTVYSKNFKGGEIVAVFGGCDVNLTQADFEGEIILDITAIFGGAKIIIPPGWQIKPEVTAVFGGMDDKRSIQPAIEGQNKLLIIRGIALFGGVDIRNY